MHIRLYLLSESKKVSNTRIHVTNVRPLSGVINMGRNPDVGIISPIEDIKARIELTVCQTLADIRAAMLGGFDRSRILSCQLGTKGFTAPPHRLTPTGLLNTGSSCYLNACLQALLPLPAFVAILHAISASLHAQIHCGGGDSGDGNGMGNLLKHVLTEENTESFPLLRLL